MTYHGFQRALDQIRSVSETEVEKGRLFERLMATYFREDPIYRDRFSQVRCGRIGFPTSTSWPPERPATVLKRARRSGWT